MGRGVAAGTPSDGSGGGGSDWEGGMRNPRHSILDEVWAPTTSVRTFALNMRAACACSMCPHDTAC